jgi:hypothetical protein
MWTIREVLCRRGQNDKKCWFIRVKMYRHGAQFGIDIIAKYGNGGQNKMKE